jgi:RNA polymerase sigma-70 factor (ECF subfamily)
VSERERGDGSPALQMGAGTIIRTHPRSTERSVTPSAGPTGPRLVQGPDDAGQSWERAGDSGPTDVDLVARCATDPEAFGLLYDKYCDRIHRFVYSRLRDRAAAEDVTAEVFFKALKALATYRPAAGPFAGWLYRIAGNAVIDHLRAKRPTVSLELEMDSTDPAAPVEDQAIDRVEVAHVWRAIDGLSQAQRTAVVLRLDRDLPIAEIAGRMNRSEGAVKLLLHRGLTALRERLRDADVGWGHS